MKAPAQPDAVAIAIIGCGAVVEQQYLPALALCERVRCEALVDPELDRIKGLASRFGVPSAVTSIDDLPPDIRGVVVAAPNDFHLPIVSAAFGRGLHVLCEKPLGRTSAEVEVMTSASAASQRGLFAAMVCRRYPAVRETVENRLLELVGDLREIDAAYGYPLDWPVKSPSFYDKTRSGGGSLLDFGAHMVDALLHVLGNPRAEVVSYADDADAGVDAEAEARVAFDLPEGRVEGTLRTSRLRRLPNRLLLRGQKASLTIPLSPIEPATVSTGSGSRAVTTYLAGLIPCFAEQLEDVGRAVRGENHQLPSGASQIPAIGLIQEMYARRQALRFCWEA